MTQFVLPAPVATAVENVPDVAPAQRTAIVLGIPKGGTSMVAAVLDALGVYMGDEKDVRRKGAFENPEFMKADVGCWDREIRRCNRLHDIWGFKNPHGNSVLRRLTPEIRSPYFIVIMRDPVAVAQRWQMWQPARWGTGVIGAVVCEATDLWSSVRDQYPKMPCLWLSYERAKQDREETVRAIVEFLGLSPTLGGFMQAVCRISPVGGYLSEPN